MYSVFIDRFDLIFFGSELFFQADELIVRHFATKLKMNSAPKLVPFFLLVITFERI